LIGRQGGETRATYQPLRALVRKAPPRKDQLDINETIREVIALTRSELHRTGTSPADTAGGTGCRLFKGIGSSFSKCAQA